MSLLKVAAIQMESRNHDIGGNLARATPLVEQAARAGAELICLPELLPSGYSYDETAWDAAEVADGPTAEWLAELASRLEVMVGTSFIEIAGDGFRNTFVLRGPQGELGRVCKQDVAVFENYFMEGSSGPHVIDTPLGRIGVGICYENQRAFLSRLFVEHDVDLVLQPHSCPGLSVFAPRWARRAAEGIIHRTPRRYAVGLGVPVVMANKCGPFVSPLPGLGGIPYRAPFCGGSAVVDSDGSVLAQVGPEPAVLIRSVRLSAARKTHRALPAKGLWASEVPWPVTQLAELIDARGQASYAKNPRRITAARRSICRGK